MRAGKFVEPSDATPDLQSGDIVYFDTTAPAGWRLLRIGTENQILKTNASDLPEWSAP